MIVFIYRICAQLMELEPIYRVLLAAGISTVLISFVLRITYRGWKGFLLWCSLKIYVGWYLLISNHYYDARIRLGRRNNDQLRNRQNTFSGTMRGKYEKKQGSLAAVWKKKKKFSLLWGILIFPICVSAVLVPRYQQSSWTVLSKISAFYDAIEEKVQIAGEGQEPFWRWRSEEIRQGEALEETEELKGTEVETEEETQQVIFLQLTERGKKKGSRVRQGPSKGSAHITTITGDVIVKRIGQDENGAWIQIELEDGTQGWIYNTLVEEIK